MFQLRSFKVELQLFMLEENNIKVNATKYKQSDIVSVT